MPLTIFKSSAGSGKTYTLAKEYIKLALRAPEYYQRILAVTFTNRAAEEMKQRILEFLVEISKGEHELIQVYASELKKTPQEIITAAGRSLTHLLHHYGYFNVMTIDTFFHSVVRAFSREIGLGGNFSIELDADKVAEFISSTVYEGVENNKLLKDWLVEFSMDGLVKGDGYEVRGQIDKLAKQLFQEEFKRLPQQQFSSEHIKEEIAGLKSKLIDDRRSFEDHMNMIAGEFQEELKNAGLTVDDLLYKSAGAGGFFKKLLRKEYTTLMTKRVLAAREDPLAWTSKSNPLSSQIAHLAEVKFMPLMDKAVKFNERHQSSYATAGAALGHLQTLGLISDLFLRLQEYKEEQEIIMISDLPDFLSQIIDDTGSPFIYEKVGSWYSHFLIDEFQDTSQIQWNNFRPLLEESLASGNENILVGDAKQSIYGWRGGDPTILMHKVGNDLPSKLIEANTSKNTNWRSAKNLVEFNNRLFSTLPTILARELEQSLGSSKTEIIEQIYLEAVQKVAPKNEAIGGRISIEFLDAEKREWKKEAINRTIDTMEQLLLDGHELNDMAILVRTNREAAEIVNAVLDYRRVSRTTIEVISAEGMLLANSSVVQLLLSAFKHLLNPDDVSVKTDLTFRYQKLARKAKFNSHQDFLQILGAKGLPPGFTKFKDHLLHLPIQELVEVLIRTLELNSVKDEFVYLQAFQDAVLDFSKSRRSDLRLFMEWWQEYGHKRSVQMTGALQAVEIITSHKSKGLQYPIVFIPFGNFEMNSRSKPVWYESPYEEGKSLLVDYKSELDKTAFSAEYYAEFIKWHLESLNVLYVSFTRAETGLFVFCEVPSSKKEKIFSNASKLLWSFFEENPMDGWDEKSKKFMKGTLPINHRKQEGEVIQLNKYVSNKWSSKIQVRKTGKTYFDDEVEKSRSEGILLHQILSEILDHTQTGEVLEKYERSMQITKEVRLRYQLLFDRLWEDEQIRSWFNGEGVVKTEVLVLPEDGEFKRMDRVIIHADTAEIVDFKSGQKKEGDHIQLLGYIKLLRDMGYSTKGYLLYLRSGEVVEV